MDTEELRKRFVHDYAIMRIQHLIEKGELNIDDEEAVFLKYVTLCSNSAENFILNK